MVLFTSNKALQRAENIRAVFEAYSDSKVFVQTKPVIPLSCAGYSVRVCDEFIGRSPGKAIMIGHGIAGGKTYGLDQPNPYHSEHCARLLTWVVTSSKDMIPLVAKQCGVSESQVLALGMPRTDAYFGKKKGDGRTGSAQKRVYLYAPTYRSDADPRECINWKYIDKKLTDEEILIVKPHMMTKKILRRPYKHIVEVSSDVPSAPYLIDCDVLITDYSSILFDAHILGKPVVLFERVLGYLQTRGMYLPYPDGYASRYCRSEDDLLTLCREAKEPMDADRRCLKLCAGACDGHSTERVIKLIKETR